MKTHQSTGHRNGRTVSTAANGGPGTPPPAEGRDPGTGRFTAGNKAAVGSGNPHARHQGRLRAELLEAVGTGGIRRIAAALIRNLERGDLDSGKVLLRYCIGGVLPTVDPDMLDADELGKAQAGARVADVLQLDTVSPAVALVLTRIVRRLSLQLLAQGGPAAALVGTAAWDKVFAELNDPELSEWWAELCELQREAQQAAAREAARKPAHADGGGGTARK
jgi:hypothetical protein